VTGIDPARAALSATWRGMTELRGFTNTAGKDIAVQHVAAIQAHTVSVTVQVPNCPTVHWQTSESGLLLYLSTT
jgi:hypothetical protein